MEVVDYSPTTTRGEHEVRRLGLGALLVGMTFGLVACSDDGGASGPSPSASGTGTSPTSAVSVTPTGPTGSESPTSTYDPRNPPPSLTIRRPGQPDATIPYNRVVDMPLVSEPTTVTETGLGTGRGIIRMDVVWLESDLDRGCHPTNTEQVGDMTVVCFERLWWAQDLGRRVVEGLTARGETSGPMYDAALALSTTPPSPSCAGSATQKTWSASCWAERDDIFAKVVALRQAWPAE